MKDGMEGLLQMHGHVLRDEQLLETSARLMKS